MQTLRQKIEHMVAHLERRKLNGHTFVDLDNHLRRLKEALAADGADVGAGEKGDSLDRIKAAEAETDAWLSRQE